MAQFCAYESKDEATTGSVPFLLDVQVDPFRGSFHGGRHPIGSRFLGKAINYLLLHTAGAMLRL